ncbi:expressed unknown protein (Partial), partial [Seminavis robusta]|eukprot:Sro2396_g325960.1 n/a (81) ;mRNA; r:2-245
MAPKLRPNSTEELCADEPSNGLLNGDECYSVDISTCQIRNNEIRDCVLAEGTYDYYLTKDEEGGGYPRISLWTVLFNLFFF